MIEDYSINQEWRFQMSSNLLIVIMYYKMQK